MRTLVSHGPRSDPQFNKHRRSTRTSCAALLTWFRVVSILSIDLSGAACLSGDLHLTVSTIGRLGLKLLWFLLGSKQYGSSSELHPEIESCVIRHRQKPLKLRCQPCAFSPSWLIQFKPHPYTGGSRKPEVWTSSSRDLVCYGIAYKIGK